MADERKQLNIRISAHLYQQIENTGRQKQDVVADALQLYFGSHSNIDVARDLEHEKEKSRILEANNKTLEQQLGFLQLEYQKISNRLLLEEPKKPWYKFWKK